MKTSHIRRVELPGRPLGSADPDALAARSYVEEEYLLRGRAPLYRSTDAEPARTGDEVDYVTRLLVRRPRDARAASGVVHVEPLHPHREEGLTWNAAAESFLALGHTWVGVTVYPAVAELLRDRVDPERYAELAVPAGAEWTIMCDTVDAARAGELGGAVRSVILSGWSATGSFCRVFATEGFAAGRVDGVVVFISSGGAGEAGYPRLSPGDRVLPDAHPKRTMPSVGVPVFEVISETEAASHRRHVRADADDYRLYQVAGAAHVEDWPGPVTDNAARLAAIGVDAGPIPVEGLRTDARTDLIAQALLEAMVGAVDRGIAPPHADRFLPDGDRDEPARDADGNVRGGIRSPWIAAPLARYLPHAKPAPRAGEAGGPSWTPLRDAAMAATLVGIREPFPPERVRARYGDRDRYVAAFSAAVDALLAEGLLLADGAAALRASAPGRWDEAVSRVQGTPVP